MLVSSPLSSITQFVAPGIPTVTVYGSPEFTKETLEYWHRDAGVHIDSAKDQLGRGAAELVFRDSLRYGQNVRFSRLC